MTDEVTQLIRTLEQVRYDAMIAADIAALDGLLAPELIYTHSNGERDSKGSYLDRVQGAHFVYHSISHRVEEVIVYPHTAIVTGIMQADVTVAGQRRQLNNNNLAVWIRREGRWCLSAYQPTPISNTASPGAPAST